MHKKKVLAVLLCMAMSFSSLGTAFAAETAEGNAAVETPADQQPSDGADTGSTDGSTDTGTGTTAGDTASDQTNSNTTNTTNTAGGSSETNSAASSQTGTDTSAAGTTTVEQTAAAPAEAAAEEKALEEGSYEAWLQKIQESTKTNEELLAEQNISHVESHDSSNFRFYQVKETYAFTKEDTTIYSAADENADKVGKLANGGLCFILKDEGEWAYIESGQVRGFLKKSSLMADRRAKIAYENATEKAEEENKDIREVSILAEALLAPYENAAFNYYMGTTENPVVEKKYAVVTLDSSTIYDSASIFATKVGQMEEGNLAYVIEDVNAAWVYVESGDVRGFALKRTIDYSNEMQEEVAAKGEDHYILAEELVDPSENKALYYTTKSVKEGSPYTSIRSQLLEYAKQFLGTPYVFGGTSLTEGCDCSGYAMGIYAHFGYSLPRTSSYQSVSGTQIPVSEAQPGDLIFYATNGIVHHVVIYQGDGKTVEAKGTGYGVCESTVASNAVWAVSIIQDQIDENYIGNTNEGDD
jgi:peptidoglycan DL-endopeptidase CwlO